MEAAVNSVKVGTASQAYLEGKAVKETRALISELCRHFYNLGWVSGTGGSIIIKVHDDNIPKPHQLILMSPSGVQKERMEPEDTYVISHNGSVLSAPSPKPYPHKPPKCSDCGVLFMKAYEMCDAGVVIHSQGIESCLVTMLNPLAKEFQITHMEMIKGIKGHGYYDELVVPIIETQPMNMSSQNLLLKLLKPTLKQQQCLFATMEYTFGETHGSVLKLRLSVIMNSLMLLSNFSNWDWTGLLQIMVQYKVLGV